MRIKVFSLSLFQQQCIEIHFDKPSNFLYLWNAFTGKFRYHHCIKMGIEIHLLYQYGVEIHFNKLLNSLDLCKVEVGDFNTSLGY